MLRIFYSDTDRVQRWNLCGQLAGPWVEELRLCWQHAHKLAPLSSGIVDLRDVTFIDEAGESLLCEMRSAGVEFVAAGVETKDLLANLKSKGERPLRRLIRNLSSPCGRKTRGETNEK